MKLTILALMFINSTQVHQLPPGLLSALCWIESHHKVRAINLNDGGSPSFGVCQIKYETAQALGFKGSIGQLRKPEYNVYWAGKYLRVQLDRYRGDPRKAIAAYNAGSHRINKRGLTKNRKYVSKVFNAWANDK